MTSDDIANPQKYLGFRNCNNQTQMSNSGWKGSVMMLSHKTDKGLC